MIRTENKTSARAFVLFSGGLDSLLAVKILEKQKVKVEGICFESNFYNSQKALESAKQNGIKLHVLDIKQEMLNLLNGAPHGYGKNLNPCIDCHAMMIKLANLYLKRKLKNETYFLATGEVLGQRPFSQNKQALETVKRTAGTEVLRPLSARLLPETEIEKNAWVDREKLGEISGRSREKQFELASLFKIRNFPSPSGGCLLTDGDFCKRLKRLKQFWPDFESNDVELLKNGRVFWFEIEAENPVLVVVGRDKEENNNLLKLAKPGDFMIELKEITGPLVVIRATSLDSAFISKFLDICLEIPFKLDYKEIYQLKNKEELVNMACLLAGWYSSKARGKKVDFKIFKK